MEPDSDRKIPRTPASVIAAACVTGALGAFIFGFFTALAVAFGGGGDFAPLAVLIWGLIGAAIGVSFAGLVALVARNELSRSFSYPFFMSFFGVPGAMSILLLDTLARSARAHTNHLILGIGLAAIILGVICGAVLSRHITAFRESASKCAVVGASSILVLAIFFSGLLLIMSGILGAAQGGGDQGETFWFLLISTIALSVVGGVIGAVVGAMRSA